MIFADILIGVGMITLLIVIMFTKEKPIPFSGKDRDLSTSQKQVGVFLHCAWNFTTNKGSAVGVCNVANRTNN